MNKKKHCDVTLSYLCSLLTVYFCTMCNGLVTALVIN